MQLPALRKVLWLGEAWHGQLDEDMAAVAPDARRWGMFGSTETWVVGTNTPQCPADMFHLLPEQLVHVDDDELLDFTTLNPDMLNPVLRYRTGDAGRFVDCPCGTGPAMQILGRRDSVVQVRGLGLHVDDIIAQVERDPAVSQAQIVITRWTAGVHSGGPRAAGPGPARTTPSASAVSSRRPRSRSARPSCTIPSPSAYGWSTR